MFFDFAFGAISLESKVGPTLLGPLPTSARWRDLDENNIRPVEIEGVSEEVQRVGWRALITCARPRGRVGPENT
jgi:hypothetical protein